MAAEAKSDGELTFDEWLKSKKSSDKVDTYEPEVFLLGRSTAETADSKDSTGVQKMISDSLGKSQNMKAKITISSYSGFLSSEEYKSDGSDTARVCVMSEPGDSEAEMEAVYKKARELGMSVMVVWIHTLKKALSMSAFFQRYSDSGVLQLLGDADGTMFQPKPKPDAPNGPSDHALNLVGKNHGFNGNKQIKKRICMCVENTVRMLNPHLYGYETVHNLLDTHLGEWQDIDMKDDFVQRGLINCFKFFKTVRDNSFKGHLQMTPDPKFIIFSKNDSYCNWFVVDLTKDPIKGVKRIAESKKKIKFEYLFESGVKIISDQLICDCAVTYSEVKESLLTREGLVSTDELWKAVKDVWTQGLFGGILSRNVRGEISTEEYVKIPKTSTPDFLLRLWHIIVKHLPKEIEFLPEYLKAFRDRFDSKSSQRHWTEILNRYNPVSKKLQAEKVYLFKNCMLSVGLAPTSEEYDALDWAIKTGNRGMIHAALGYKKSTESSSDLEENMAQQHWRWKNQNEYFVQEYILKRHGKKGEECLRVLQEALTDMIKDRGDFGSIDLFGIVWYSNEESQKALRTRLMMSLDTVLDYDTVHDDKSGWMWVRDAVLKHPVWLCKEDPVDTSSTRILFHELTENIGKHVAAKCGSEIEDEFKNMVAAEPIAWDELRNYAPKNFTGDLRQDIIKGGVSRTLKDEQIEEINKHNTSLDVNIAKMYDAGLFMSDMLLQAHLINPFFGKLMKKALKKHGKVMVAPVKNSTRVVPKSEEYAGENRKWPHTACVIDLIRCCVIVQNLSQVVTACKDFEQFIEENSKYLTLSRCKNGFARYKGRDIVPTQYTDVKFNLACTDESGERAIIGECQILLDCVMKAKNKAHELYEVSRSLPLYKGAAHRLKSEMSFDRQLLVNMVRPVTFSPFSFKLGEFELNVVLKYDYSSRLFIRSMAEAIVKRSNESKLDAILPEILKSFEKFKDRSAPFGKKTGLLLCEIVVLIERLKAAQKSLDISEEMEVQKILEMYKKIVEKMKKTKLTMDVCYNLFIGIDPKIKSQIKFEQCLEFPNYRLSKGDLNRVFNAFGGFSQTTGLAKLLERSVPTDWYDPEEEDGSKLPRAVQRGLQRLIDNDTKREVRVSPDWVPYVVQFTNEDLMMQLFMLNKMKNTYQRTVNTLMKREKYLTPLCEWFEKMPKAIYLNFFKNHTIFKTACETYNKDLFTQEHVDRYQPLMPIVGVFDNWRYVYPFTSLWSRCRMFFPETYLLSPSKREQVYNDLSKGFRMEDFVEFFGKERTPGIKLFIWEDSVKQFAKRYAKECSGLEDAALVESVMSLLPSPEWSFFNMCLNGTDDAELQSSLKSIAAKLPASAKKGSEADYAKVEKKIVLGGNWTFDAYFAVMSDSMDLLKTVKTQFADEFNQIMTNELYRLFYLNYANPEVTQELAKLIIAKYDIKSVDQMRNVLIQCVMKSPIAITFGSDSGILIATLFRSVCSGGAAAAGSDDQKDSEATDQAVISFMDALMDETDFEQRRIWELTGLFLSVDQDRVISKMKNISMLSDFWVIPHRPKVLRNLATVFKKVPALSDKTRNTLIGLALNQAPQDWVNTEGSLALVCESFAAFFDIIGEAKYAAVKVKEFNLQRVMDRIKKDNANGEYNGLLEKMSKVTVEGGKKKK